MACLVNSNTCMPLDVGDKEGRVSVLSPEGALIRAIALPAPELTGITFG